MFYFQSFSLSIQHFIASDFYHVATVQPVVFWSFFFRKKNIQHHPTNIVQVPVSLSCWRLGSPPGWVSDRLLGWHNPWRKPPSTHEAREMSQDLLLKIAQLLVISILFSGPKFSTTTYFDIWVWLLCTMKSCDGLLASIFSRGLETQLIRPLPQSSWRMAAEATRMKRWRRACWRGGVGISRISCNLYLEICSMSSNRVTMNGSIHWSLASNVAIQPTKHAMLRVCTYTCTYNE